MLKKRSLKQTHSDVKKHALTSKKHKILYIGIFC